MSKRINPICQFCEEEFVLNTQNQPFVEHLVVLKNITNNYLVHGPIADKGEIIQMIKMICDVTGIELKVNIELSGPNAPKSKDPIIAIDSKGHSPVL